MNKFESKQVSQNVLEAINQTTIKHLNLIRIKVIFQNFLINKHYNNLNLHKFILKKKCTLLSPFYN